VQLRFNAPLAALSPNAFLDAALTPLRPRLIVVGEDFRFGAKRAGDVASLRAQFAVEAVGSIDDAHGRISSTRVRAALKAGEFAQARALLGRPFTMAGRVVRGQQLGRKLGYPTANLRILRRHSPLHGIYAVRVHGLESTALPGVASIGTRPTVDGREWLLETHLFDFDADIYGRRLEIEFVQFLREERKFDALPPLIEQMHHDAAAARACLI
jgi:riboflavin kinase / FMN adenylyltransferase